MEPRISSFLSYLGSLNIITDFGISRKRVESIGIYYTHCEIFHRSRSFCALIPRRIREYTSNPNSLKHIQTQ